MRIESFRRLLQKGPDLPPVDPQSFAGCRCWPPPVLEQNFRIGARENRGHEHSNLHYLLRSRQWVSGAMKGDQSHALLCLKPSKEVGVLHLLSCTNWARGLVSHSDTQ